VTAEQLFQIANPAALIGWIVLAAAIVFRSDYWRDQIAGRAFPLGFAALYSALILFFIGTGEGGFDSLTNVQKLFTSNWLALAGWVHYLAFDLFVGAWIARQVITLDLPRWPLAVILPLTFLFGPAGLLAFEIVNLALSKTEDRS
jgi:hypothetical protein